MITQTELIDMESKPMQQLSDMFDLCLFQMKKCLPKKISRAELVKARERILRLACEIADMKPDSIQVSINRGLPEITIYPDNYLPWGDERKVTTMCVKGYLHAEIKLQAMAARLLTIYNQLKQAA